MRRRSGLEIPETIEDTCDPATMALIVYDMQGGVLRQLPDSGAEAVARVSRVLTAARAGGYPVDPAVREPAGGDVRDAAPRMGNAPVTLAPPVPGSNDMVAPAMSPELHERGNHAV